MKYFFIILICYSNYIFSQTLKNNDIELVIVKESIISDFYFYFKLNKFKKNEKPIIYFSNENIKFNSNRFHIKQNDSIVHTNQKKYLLPNKINDIERANFIVFNTPLINNKIMFEVFFKRETFLNIPNTSEYEFWRRMNCGISYFFEYDNNNDLIDFKKVPFSYD